MSHNIIKFTHLCFECRSCVQICPKNAIMMIENVEGFSYPDVNEHLCVHCGLCLRACPAINTKLLFSKHQNIYAAQARDSNILNNSSSGGLFSVIANFIIRKGGVVFGACWDNDLHLNHTFAVSPVSIDRFRGSKYVHSNIGNSFIKVREFLNQNRCVYFTGTPCQIAGLKLFLGKEYSNLITSDLICHGTPSQKLFDVFTSQIQSEHGNRIIDYKFRDKKIFGWSCNSSSFVSKNEITGRKEYHYYDRNMIAYYQAFINGHIAREDCYKCPFACINRVGDITLADYWDVGKHHPNFKNINKGVSLIMTNTEKGDAVLDDIKNEIYVERSTMEKALNTTNTHLRQPTSRTKERDMAYKFAFEDLDAFKDYYSAFAPTERYYKYCYRNYLLKRIPIVKIFVNFVKFLKK